MVSCDPSLPLSALDVFVIDCQATAAAPAGRLLEVGWARAREATAGAQASLIAMPEGERIPPAVARITGITDGMARAGIRAEVAWRDLVAAAATLTPQPAPTVIHFARFERPFLCRLADGVLPFDIVCTHAIAARLLPDLPRRGLRALAGYFGRSVGQLRRSADHVSATAFVWRHLLPLLDREGVATWSELKAWLEGPAGATRHRRRVWPMPRSHRLSLPHAPGIYRMLRTNGDVLYVGKAASLHDRANSYFRQQHGVPERLLEMLSQAREISYQVTATALEAAVLEADEIKRLRPPYNIALTDAGRRLWFASPDLFEHATSPSRRCPLGPFPSGGALDEFAALARGSRAALGRDRRAAEVSIFEEGYGRFCTAHAELFLDRVRMPARLLRLGTRLWREGRRERERETDESRAGSRTIAWTPEAVQLALEWLALRAALARRRAIWFTRLADASIAWREPGLGPPRLIVIENGDMSVRAIEAAEVPPAPPGHRRSAGARRLAFTVARFDRLRVLTSELKRLVSAGTPLSVRFGPSAPLAGARLASLLAWL